MASRGWSDQARSKTCNPNPTKSSPGSPLEPKPSPLSQTPLVVSPLRRPLWAKRMLSLDGRTAHVIRARVVARARILSEK